jgi:hypothetical protein
MKFNCGLDGWERWLRRKARIQVWHTWFAWRPVRVDEFDCRWLEMVERRAECYSIIRGVRAWKYRALSRRENDGR